MPTCLLGLGSNEGDREATLRAAIDEIEALPDVHVVAQSKWFRTKPVGGPANQGEFVNGAAIIETKSPPLRLLNDLQQIETRRGRKRGEERWSPRTLDIDILLYNSDVAETEMLTLPHPRMSFRRFVLEPAAEIAPKMLHPVIGWPIERLLMHLGAASDRAAIVSPSDAVRGEIASALSKRFGISIINPPTFAAVEHHWPAKWTTWMEFPNAVRDRTASAQQQGAPPYASAEFPKLSVLLDADIKTRGAAKLDWSTLVRRPGRGPMLRLQTTDSAEIESEVFAAIEAVWPDLGPRAANHVKSL